MLGHNWRSPLRTFWRQKRDYLVQKTVVLSTQAFVLGLQPNTELLQFCDLFLIASNSETHHNLQPFAKILALVALSRKESQRCPIASRKNRAHDESDTSSQMTAAETQSEWENHRETFLAVG